MQSCGVPNISLLEHFSTALYTSGLSARLPARAAICSLQFAPYTTVENRPLCAVHQVVVVPY